MIKKRQGVGRKTEGKFWIVALMAVCGGIFFWDALRSSNTTLDVTWVVGDCLVYALLLWGAFRMVFVRKRGAKINRIAFAAIYLASVSGSLVAAFRYNQGMFYAASSIQKEMKRIETDIAKSGSGPVRLEVESKEDVLQDNDHGEYGELAKFFKNVIRLTITYRSEYIVENTAIGWDSILNPKRINADAGFSDSMSILEKKKKIMDKYEKKEKNLYSLFPLMDRVIPLKMSERLKTDILAGFDNNSDVIRRLRDNKWKMDREIVRNVERILSMLQKSDSWTGKDQHFVFYDDEELAQFQSYMHTIQNLKYQLEKMQKKKFENAQKIVESVKQEACEEMWGGSVGSVFDFALRL